MWPSTTTVRIRSREIDASIEIQTPIIVNIDIQRLEIRWGIDKAALAGLDEVVGHNNVFLVRSDFDVVRANGWLVFVWIVQTDWVCGV